MDNLSPVIFDSLADRPAGLTIIKPKKRIVKKSKSGLLVQVPLLKPFDYVGNPRRTFRN